MTKLQNLSQARNRKGELFFYLTLLTVLFFFLQIGYVIKFSGFYFGDAEEVASHLSIPLKIIPPLLFFLFIQIVIHFLYILLIWVLGLLIGRTLQLSWDKTEKMSFSLWALGLLAVICGNQYFLPNSKFAGLTEGFLSQSAVGVLLVGLIIILGGAFFIGIIGVIKNNIKTSLIGLLFLGFYFFQQHSVTVKDAASIEKPNVIIIGIDSLRPDFLGFFGGQQNTVDLDNFLNQSTVFSEALTPLARTFPAWVSILTGLYPVISGARTNLENPKEINLTATLPALLRDAGYSTIFATDETRFSNIDQQFGFDKIITPPIGLNDFLLGALNDFPLSNLLINTKLGKWIFPYNYGNRPSFATYDPDSFLNLLKPTLSKSREKPVFLAVHFCLPHYPYFWGTAILNDKSIINYGAAVERVNQQFAMFFKMLEQNQFLQHAVVVLLSDHGEAIELHGDRATDPDLYIAGKANSKRVIPHFYPPMLETEKVDESAGHGTDVLGLPQYHSVLAMRLFGLSVANPKTVAGRVSLLDIKPTVLDFLKINATTGSGQSLKKVVLGEGELKPAQDFFTESDFSPQAIRTVHPDQRHVLFEGINYFQIDPHTTRITVKPSMEKMILNSKQFADFRGEWVLALYPQGKKVMLPILVNLRTGQWTDDLTTAFAKNSPADQMLVGLRGMFFNR